MKSKNNLMFYNSIVYLYNKFSRCTNDITNDDTSPSNADDDIGINVNIIIRCKNYWNLDSFISSNNSKILRKASIQNKTNSTLNFNVRFLYNLFYRCATIANIDAAKTNATSNNAASATTTNIDAANANAISNDAESTNIGNTVVMNSNA